MKHYTYKITDPQTGEFYFGVRTHPTPDDDEYMGSYQTWKPEDESRLVKEVIRDDFESRESAMNHEIKLIKNSIDDKLNRNYHIPTIGFNPYGKKFTKEHKDKIGRANSGKILTEEHKHKLSLRKLGKNNPYYGKSRPEHSKWLRENHPNKREVLQYDKDGNFIKQWSCAREVYNQIGIQYRNISACCYGKRNSAGGYVWKFKNK